jgi:hypothetical protein
MQSCVNEQFMLFVTNLVEFSRATLFSRYKYMHRHCFGPMAMGTDAHKRKAQPKKCCLNFSLRFSK